MGNAPLIATLTTGLFAGAALYITLVEHPARVSCGSTIAVLEWRPSYKRATVLQASLALIGAFSAFASWLGGNGTGWLVASLALGAVVPFTLVAIAPTNTRLADESLDEDSAEALALLEQWGRLHAVRTNLSVVAFAIEVILLGS